MNTEEAIAILRGAAPEYQFALNDGRLWWESGDLAKAMGVSKRQVALWAATIDGALQTSSGWRIPRSELLKFVAQIVIDRKARGTEKS